MMSRNAPCRAAPTGVPSLVTHQRPCTVSRRPFVYFLTQFVALLQHLRRWRPRQHPWLLWVHAGAVYRAAITRPPSSVTLANRFAAPQVFFATLMVTASSHLAIASQFLPVFTILAAIIPVDPIYQRWVGTHFSAGLDTPTFVGSTQFVGTLTREMESTSDAPLRRVCVSCPMVLNPDQEKKALNAPVVIPKMTRLPKILGVGQATNAAFSQHH